MLFLIFIQTKYSSQPATLIETFCVALTSEFGCCVLLGFKAETSGAYSSEGEVGDDDNNNNNNNEDDDGAYSSEGDDDNNNVKYI